MIAQTCEHICDRRHSHTAGCGNRVIAGESKQPRHKVLSLLLTFRDAALSFRGLPFRFSKPIARAYFSTTGRSDRCSLLEMLESEHSTSVTGR